MSRHALNLALASFALCALPLGACSIDTGQVSEETEPALDVDDSTVRDLRIVVAYDDGSREELPMTRWPVGTLDLIRTIPMDELVINEEGYPIAITSDQPWAEAVEAQAEESSPNEFSFHPARYPALWTVRQADFSPCPDAEDPPALNWTHDAAGEDDAAPSAAEPLVALVFGSDEAIGEIVGPCNDEVDESVFFEPMDALVADRAVPVEVSTSDESEIP